MLTFKKPKANLRLRYARFIELSLILALVMLIAAFKFFPDIEYEAVTHEIPQDLITVEDIQNTRQDTRPLPPQKPPVLIEAPSDDILNDIELSTTEIDFDAVIDAPPDLPPDDSHKKVIVEEDLGFIPVPSRLPEPIGGIAAIQQKVVYPEIAIRAGVEGRVYIRAFIDAQGNVVRALVEKGIGAGCDEAALDAVKQTKFTPGEQRGRPVKVQMVIPVQFKLN